MEKILTTIEPYSTLNMNLEDEDEKDSIAMSITLDGNLNDKKTMFAGSIFSVMVLAGWTLAYKTINAAKHDYDLVIRESSVKYRLPVKSDAKAVATIKESLKDLRNGKKSITISVNLVDADKNSCASFIGEYIAIKKS